jgi:hypothetical protein
MDSILVNMETRFWVNLQAEYDVRQAEIGLLPGILRRIRPLEGGIMLRQAAKEITATPGAYQTKNAPFYFGRLLHFKLRHYPLAGKSFTPIVYCLNSPLLSRLSRFPM